MIKPSKEKRTRNHPQKEEVHAKIADKEEPKLKEHTPIHAIKEIKGKTSSREGKSAIKDQQRASGQPPSNRPRNNPRDGLREERKEEQSLKS